MSAVIIWLFFMAGSMVMAGKRFPACVYAGTLVLVAVWTLLAEL